MNLKTLCLLVAAALLPVPAIQAQDKPKAKTEAIYGYQMMTPQERDEHRAKMGAAQTQEERERIRAEHHALMKERAKERGITMPDQPPARGMGGGMGPSGGMGPGGGMGRGR